VISPDAGEYYAPPSPAMGRKEHMFPCGGEPGLSKGWKISLPLLRRRPHCTHSLVRFGVRFFSFVKTSKRLFFLPFVLKKSDFSFLFPHMQRWSPLSFFSLRGAMVGCPLTPVDELRTSRFFQWDESGSPPPPLFAAKSLVIVESR